MGAKPKDTSITVTAYGTKVAAVSAKSLKRNAIGLGPPVSLYFMAVSDFLCECIDTINRERRN